MQDLNIFPIILYEVRWGAVHVFPIPETHKLTSWSSASFGMMDIQYIAR